MQLAFAAVGSVLAATLFAWPLPLSLGTRVTGRVSGDTGVYIWNLWQFRHQIVVHNRFPYFTGEILSLSPQVDLSLHNYTAFADAVAFPLIPLVGVVTTFNVIYLASTAATAFTTFLLARRVTGRALEAWLAAMLFAFSPALVARSTAHFSLVQAAALPLFAYCWDRMLEGGRLRFAVASGLSLAWAMMSDAYYGVYCVLLAGLMGGVRFYRVERGRAPTGFRWMWWIDAPIAAAALVSAAIAVTGGTRLDVGPVRIALFTLYTPVLVLTTLVLVRLFLVFRPRVVAREGTDWRALAPAATVAVASAVVPLAPMLWTLGARLIGGGRLQREVYWRTGPPGVDLLAFFTPNPVNPWLGGSALRLFERQHDAIEGVAAVTITALVVIAVAALVHRWRPPTAWLVITLAFGALAVGPFVRIAGLNTYVPGPWSVLRYLPLLGTARTPARFTIVVMLGVSVMFAAALAAWRARSRHPRIVLAVVAPVLVFELMPAPRVLYSAEYPPVFRIIADDPRPIRVLHLPFGIRDGTMAVGEFNIAYQFYQTLHEKPLIGGYLSRIPRAAFAEHARAPFLDTVIRLSEGGRVTPEEMAAAAANGPRLTRRWRVGYVVIDRRRASDDLVRLVLGSLPLELVAESWPFVLYRTRFEPVSTAADGDVLE